jgi:hypothetical protein
VGALEVANNIVWAVQQLNEDPAFHPRNQSHRTRIWREVEGIVGVNGRRPPPIVGRFLAMYADWYPEGSPYDDDAGDL